MKRRFALVLVTGLAMITAAGAGGYTIGRSVNVPRGSNAVFIPTTWFCRNFGHRVECQSGDAYPWVEIPLRARFVTVRVHTASGGGVHVRIVRHPPVVGGPPANEIVYTFTAF